MKTPKLLLAALLMAFGGTSWASTTSLMEMARAARTEKKRLTLTIMDRIPVRAARAIAKVSSPYSRTTLVLPFMDGHLLESSQDAGIETICVLNVWQGLLKRTNGKTEGILEFDLSGTWTIFDVARKRGIIPSTSESHERAEFEVALWPTFPEASLVEKSVYSIDVIVRAPKGQPTEITPDHLKNCFGPSSSIHLETPRTPPRS